MSFKFQQNYMLKVFILKLRVANYKLNLELQSSKKNCLVKLWNYNLLKFFTSWTFKLDVIETFESYCKINCNN